ncbi:MAG: preprotein translocase subunit SecG [Clostridiales bacterium 43-6]|nr:MAG: preprotein translocase subunit SecG [Clostridiales bacterium 43-6]
MTVIQWILGSVTLLFALILTLVVLLQQGRRKGISGTISGGADTFLSKGKARAVDAALARWTKFIAIGFFILVILFLVFPLLGIK